MPRKLVAIRNVGRFLSYGAGGDVELKRYNLVFAENGRGKTTLCAIFRSLETGDAAVIRGRATLGAAAPPEIRILRADGQMAVFADAAWNTTVPEFEIYDSTFVAENVSIALADDTEPQPDLTVLRRGAVSYKDRDAWAEDTLLVVEVADSSLAYDRSTKRRLYAEAGIPEYWVVDCTAETVEVHRGPASDGYREVRLVAGVGTLAPQAFPDVELRTIDIFA